MSTWGQVHVGDTVRGADQRAWTVTARDPGARWAVAGDHVAFTLALGEREVSVERPLSAGVELIERAGHQPEATAAQALIGQGMQVEIVREETMKVDQFSAPAAAPEAPDAGIKRDRWGRYVLPHPETGKEQAWTRATTLARTLADTYGLEQWAKRMVAKGMAIRPDLVAGAAAADPDEGKGTLDSIAEQATQAAGAKAGANLGTAFHQAAQRLDRGVPIESMNLPEGLVRDLTAYRQAMTDRGLTVVEMERIVVCPSLGCAGQLDRIVRQAPGVTKSAGLSILDLKSAKRIDYSWLEIAIQQAVYAHATHMWDKATKSWEPMPEVDRDRALIAWSPVGKAECTVYGLSVVKGMRYATLAMEVREARKDKDLSWLVQPETAALALHLVSRARHQQDLANLWDRFHPQGMWTEEVNAAAAKRWEEIQHEIEMIITDATFK